METTKEQIIEKHFNILTSENPGVYYEKYDTDPRTVKVLSDCMDEYALLMVTDKERRLKELEAELIKFKQKISFYCNDELINNACENFDNPQCTEQCDKCKSETQR